MVFMTVLTGPGTFTVLVTTGPGTFTVLMTTGAATVRIVVWDPAEPIPKPRPSPTIPVAALIAMNFVFTAFSPPIEDALRPGLDYTPRIWSSR